MPTNAEINVDAMMLPAGINVGDELFSDHTGQIMEIVPWKRWVDFQKVAYGKSLISIPAAWQKMVPYTIKIDESGAPSKAPNVWWLALENIIPFSAGAMWQVRPCTPPRQPFGERPVSLRRKPREG